MANNQEEPYTYYRVKADNLTEAYNFLYSSVHQVAFKIEGSAKNRKITLGMHAVESPGNIVIYDNSALTSVSVSGAPVLITLLNAMNQPDQSTPYSIFHSM